VNAPGARRGALELAVVWLIAFAASLAVPIAVLLRNEVTQPTAVAGLESIASLYAPYVGGLLAYVFAKRKAPAPKGSGPPRSALFIAFAISVLWSLAVWTMLARVLWEPIPLSDAIKAATELGGKLSWLMAPVMGYYFAVGDSPAPSKR